MTKEHRFWNTQPARIGSSNSIIQQPTAIQQKEYPLPPGLQFVDVTIDEIDAIHDLLKRNYVEDPEHKFRLVYSKEFLSWQFESPAILVGVKRKNELVGFALGREHTIGLNYRFSRALSVNFLCVERYLRNKNIAPIIIQEMTRRANLRGVFQAVFTAGIELPFKFTCGQYFHYVINPKKVAALYNPREEYFTTSYYNEEAKNDLNADSKENIEMNQKRFKGKNISKIAKSEFMSDSSRGSESNLQGDIIKEDDSQSRTLETNLNDQNKPFVSHKRSNISPPVSSNNFSASSKQNTDKFKNDSEFDLSTNSEILKEDEANVGLLKDHDTILKYVSYFEDKIFTIIHPDDIEEASQILNEEYGTYKFHEVFDKDATKYNLLSKENVKYTLVCKKNGALMSLLTFFIIDTLSVRNDACMKCAYLYHLAGPEKALMMRKAIELCERLGIDMFNILNLGKSYEFIAHLRFQPGDGKLNYYLYNWESLPISPHQTTFFLP